MYCTPNEEIRKGMNIVLQKSSSRIQNHEKLDPLVPVRQASHELPKHSLPALPVRRLMLGRWHAKNECVSPCYKSLADVVSMLAVGLECLSQGGSG